MTPLEALQLLEQATAHLQTNRESHAKILEACKIIGAALLDAEAQKKIAAQSVSPE